MSNNNTSSLDYNISINIQWFIDKRNEQLAVFTKTIKANDSKKNIDKEYNRLIKLQHNLQLIEDLVLMNSVINNFNKDLIKDSASDNSPITNTISSNNIPNDLQECYKYLNDISNIDEWLALEENDAIASIHHGIGMLLRNEWKLWSTSPLVDFFNARGIIHADDMSSIILRSFHRFKNNKKIMFTDQLNYFKNYWKSLEQDRNEYCKQHKI